jgi:hypothetical protein
MTDKATDRPGYFAEKQRSYVQRQRERGMVRVTLWVPEADKAELIDIAREMAEERGL